MWHDKRDIDMKPDSYRFRLSRFTRTISVLDLRDPLEMRRARAARYAKRNKTEGRKAVFL